MNKFFFYTYVVVSIVWETLSPHGPRRGTCPIRFNGCLPPGGYKPFITNNLFLSRFFSPVFLLS